MRVSRAAVVGAGTMGAEIAQVIAAAEIPVVLRDVADEPLRAGLVHAERITERQVASLVRKGRLEESAGRQRAAETLARIHPTTGWEGFGEVDFAIEAVPDRMASKHAVFSELDACVPGHAVLASNTSSLPLAEVAELTTRPERVVGFHFPFPAAATRLIEVVAGEESDPDAVATAVAFAQALRRSPIVCAESPGFVVNRILLAAASEIWRMQEEEGLDPRELDAAITESRAAPLGPFMLADMLGLDATLQLAEHLSASHGERFRVHAGMRELVAEGSLGRKSGRGFYAHDG